ncbi:hypothetical protein LINPERHAP1_LOCUS23945 [Linum perenne]
MFLQLIWGTAQSLGQSSQALSSALKELGTLAFVRSKSKRIRRWWLSWFRRMHSESINMQRWLVDSGTSSREVGRSR